jgi:RimJ/RimL family protein N-acetyltransferase
MDKDAEDLAILFRHVVDALPYYNEAAKRSEMAKYSALLLKASLLEDPDSVLVASIRNKLVGFCLSSYDDDLVWLNWFGVHPSYRREGVATSLLHALEASRMGKTHKIWCDCRTENEASKNILVQHQYQQLCTLSNHWYNQDYILWEKLVA